MPTRWVNLTHLHPRLPREERQEVVASLREIGMSVRAIAAATGHSKNTINEDIWQVSHTGTPAPAPESRLLGSIERLERGEGVAHDLIEDAEESHGGPDELDDEDDEPDPAELAAAMARHPAGKAPAAPEPRPVIGTDGKTYTQPAPRPPAKPRTDVVAVVNRALMRADAAAQAADEITQRCTRRWRRGV